MKLNEIYLGDAYELIKQIEDKSIDLIVTDPPYDIQGLHGGGIMKTRKAGNFAQELQNDNLDIGIDFKILDEFIRILKKINVYISALVVRNVAVSVLSVKVRPCHTKLPQAVAVVSR